MSFADLPDKQKIFIAEYMTHFNATKAAISAGYSEKSAYSTAHDILKKPEVKAIINQLIEDKLQTSKLNQYEIIAELRKLAFRSSDNTYSDLTPQDSIRALALLGKHYGMFWEKDEANTALSELEAKFKHAFKVLQERKS